MNRPAPKILKVFRYSLLIVVFAAFLIIVLDKNIPFYLAPLIAPTVSLPLIINYWLLHLFKSNKDGLDYVAFWAVVGAYITNFAIAVYCIINLYAPSVIFDGTMGEGGGYWLLFTLAGAFFSLSYLLYWHYKRVKAKNGM